MDHGPLERLVRSQLGHDGLAILIDLELPVAFSACVGVSVGSDASVASSIALRRHFSARDIAKLPFAGRTKHDIWLRPWLISHAASAET